MGNENTFCRAETNAARIRSWAGRTISPGPTCAAALAEWIGICDSLIRASPRRVREGSFWLMEIMG